MSHIQKGLISFEGDLRVFEFRLREGVTWEIFLDATKVSKNSAFLSDPTPLSKNAFLEKLKKIIEPIKD